MTSPLLPPASCDVLVVGAGPAGSACAQWLARQGLDVVLVDQHDFPRDKVCGDGLIPDAHHALQRLGVLAEVMAQAQAAAHPDVLGIEAGGGDVSAAARFRMSSSCLRGSTASRPGTSTRPPRGPMQPTCAAAWACAITSASTPRRCSA